MKNCTKKRGLEILNIISLLLLKKLTLLWKFYDWNMERHWDGNCQLLKVYK